MIFSQEILSFLLTKKIGEVLRKSLNSLYHKIEKKKPGYDDNSFGVLFITPFVYMFILQVG